jgi:hypothetical protein
METLATQLRQVLRRLARAPMFAAVALLTLAVGIGANTAIFSVVEGVLLKRLPYPHPEELVAVWLAAPGFSIKDLNPGPSDYFIFREQNHTFQDIGLYMGYSVNITGLAEPEHALGLQVTDGVLPILGVTPILGRSFTRADDSRGSAETVMLTYSYWRRKFGGDRSVIGKTITVDGTLRQIIGPLPRDFRFGGTTSLCSFPCSSTELKRFSHLSIMILSPGSSLV